MEMEGNFERNENFREKERCWKSRKIDWRERGVFVEERVKKWKSAGEKD